MEYTKEFLTFWEKYPKRKGSNPKAQAFKSFERALNRASIATIMVGLEAYAKASAHQAGTEYIPMAATWLNQDRWDSDHHEGTKEEHVPINRPHMNDHARVGCARCNTTGWESAMKETTWNMRPKYYTTMIPCREPRCTNRLNDDTWAINSRRHTQYTWVNGTQIVETLWFFDYDAEVNRWDYSHEGIESGSTANLVALLNRRLKDQETSSGNEPVEAIMGYSEEME